MKIKSVGLAVATIAIVGWGSLVLASSMNQIKSAVQNEAGGEAEISTNVGTAHVSVKEEETVNKADKTDVVLKFENSFDSAIKLYIEANLEESGKVRDVARVNAFYDGKVVGLRDGLISKEEAVNNITKIMDYLYSCVDKKFFIPFGIEKTDYEYDIQRQYHMDYEDSTASYSVLMKLKDRGLCTIGVNVGEEVKIRTFAMDGLVDLYGGVGNDIPEEYLVKNWCATTEQRTEIYNQYFTKSKDIVENFLGLSVIREEIVDVDCGSYFNADDSWSEVCFGYVLEDGTYIKVFYNRVNGEWIGFCIAGCYEE